MRNPRILLGDVPDQEENWPPVNPILDLKKSGAPPWRNTVLFMNTPFIVGTAPTLILQANLRRVYLLIQNNSAQIMYVVFNGSANTANGIQIAAGGNYEPYIAPFSNVSILGGAASLAGVVVEGVKG